MSRFKKLLWGGSILAMSFLGGMAAQSFIVPAVSFAQSQVLQADRYYFLGPDGKVSGQVYTPEGSGAIISLNGQDGDQRLQLGTYSAPGEQGLPMVGLSDNGGNLRLLLRLAGRNESPVVIFKDKEHRDRIVLGLGMEDAGEEPFLAVVDKDGNKKMIFGNY